MVMVRVMVGVRAGARPRVTVGFGVTLEYNPSPNSPCRDRIL